jgi:hypothetical protein
LPVGYGNKQDVRRASPSTEPFDFLEIYRLRVALGVAVLSWIRITTKQQKSRGFPQFA